MKQNEEDLEPWHPITDPVSMKTILKFLEELGEAVSAGARCAMQGLDGINPENGIPNEVWLEDEISDVVANVELVVERFVLNRVRMRKRVEKKKTFLRRMHSGA